jgi:hypothetical protein
MLQSGSDFNEFFVCMIEAKWTSETCLVEVQDVSLGMCHTKLADKCMQAGKRIMN